VSEHATKSEDAIVRGYPGTVASCDCGWTSSWSVRDGSAEEEAHVHMMGTDAAYRARQVERTDAWASILREQGCLCKMLTGSYSYVLNTACPTHFRRVVPVASSDHQHNCSCHLGAPCGRCENCAHIDHPECENDCQTCEEHDDD